jgi:hypothetical protein
MKAIVVIFILSVAAYFALKHTSSNPTSTSPENFSLSTASEKPIPKAAAILLWKEKALKFCSEFTPSDVEITKHTATQCSQRVNDQHLGCAKQLESEFPDLIATKTDVHQMGEAYFKCSLPNPIQAN